MTREELDKDMIESIEMWLHECEPKYVEKELAWLDELRTRLLEEKSEKPIPAELEEAENAIEDVEFDSQVFGKVMSDILAVYKSPSNPEEEPYDYEWTIARQFYELGCRAGAKWDRSRMMKEAVEGEVMTNGFYPYEPRIVAPYPNCPYDFGDKVRVIILPKEDEK